MTPDEQELENCRREMERLAALSDEYHLKGRNMDKRWLVEHNRSREILARIEAAKGSGDGTSS